ncbi:MAG TPA: ATP-binding protein [Thermoanaerobaculia bacterium]|nr:ATP-binding protein [Thermoanaerobaculia bacterium]
MTVPADLATWHQTNDAYLAAAVEWLRLLLTHRAPSPAPEPVLMPNDQRATPRPDTPPEEQSAWWSFRRSPVNPTPAPPPTRPALPAVPLVTAEDVRLAAERVRAAESVDPAPAMILLARRTGLTNFERDLLLLAVAMELDTRIAALCARAQDDGGRPFPTFALAVSLFEDASWDALSPDRPLRYWRLLEMTQQGTQPLTMAALRADERIVNYVKGLSHLDERIAPFVTILGNAVRESELPHSQRAIVDAMVRALERDQPHLRPLQLLGRDPESKQLVARAAAHRLGLTPYRVAGDMLPSPATELETLARLWQRETLLLPLALYIDAKDIDRNAEAHASPLKRFLARAGGVTFVEARETWPVPQGSHAFDVEKPTSAEQRAMWQSALGDEHADEAARLAGQFHLSVDAIRRIAADARDDDAESPLLTRLWKHAGMRTRMHIDALAQRIDAKATWDDLVLPETEKNLLQQIAAHVAGRSRVYDEWGFRNRMNRGFGISALFAGESGTGKTMAAEVIANTLGLALHRIDLSAVVSKWVGETEKNLQQLFNAADDSNGILFFDEADALFGKRTQVQQSQDRFANIEINFLLQRLESYRGLAILATNLKDALDPAFLRRLRFIVSFPFPGPQERHAIWERAFPRELPVRNLDFARLAKLNVTGGSVHNIALNAAFLAAARGEAVTMPIVFEAAKTELRKLQKPFNEAEFRLAAV